MIGTWFYVMECVAGRPLPTPPARRPARPSAQKLYDSMNEVLARLHTVDLQGDRSRRLSARTGQYIQRQIHR